jgi:competence protein ComFC
VISRELDLPILDVLIRKKMTKTQKDLKKEQRIKNVANAFAFKSPLFEKEGVRGSSFILVDDVTTTGSTLLEAAKVLKRNGAEKVICLTVARD